MSLLRRTLHFRVGHPETIWLRPVHRVGSSKAMGCIAGDRNPVPLSAGKLVEQFTERVDHSTSDKKHYDPEHIIHMLLKVGYSLRSFPRLPHNGLGNCCSYTTSRLSRRLGRALNGIAAPTSSKGSVIVGGATRLATSLAAKRQVTAMPAV